MAENKKKQNNGEFAENIANDVLLMQKNSKNPQKSVNGVKEDSVVDKKLVNKILKEEKKKAKSKENAKKKNKKAKLKEVIKLKKEQERQEKLRQEEIIRDLEKRGKLSSWFRLDNAASIYPSAAKKGWNFVFRISATLKEKVDEKLLQQATNDIMQRFPSFNVKLRHGFFWNYYERNFGTLKVQKEADFPCLPFDLNDADGFLVRVLYSDYKIIVEIFHGISDGRGTLFFVNSLIARYLELKGVKIDTYEGCANYLDIPTDEEVEDSFFKNYTTEKIKRQKERSAHKISGNVMPAKVVNTIEGRMSVTKVKEIAHKYDASVSVFLAAVVGYCVYKKCKNKKKPVRISVPIDLRARFESKTLRNFSSYINVEVQGENLSFEDVVRVFKEQMSNVDKKFLQSNINANVGLQKNFFIKIIPLFIKNLILKASYNYLGEKFQTLAISNIGLVKAPKEFEEYIQDYCVNLGRSLHNEKSIGVISYKDTLNMCISSKLYETETERDIFRTLVSLGVPVKVYSNRRDLYGTR